MNHTVFPYPGGKASYADWIVGHLPDHHCYVEVFGGSAGVLVNKPPSRVEVYNDLDDDLVQFFEILRERGQELREWCQDVPFSRKVFEQWNERWHGEGWRPDDPVERAGVMFYLHNASFSGITGSRGGFAAGTTKNAARSYGNRIDRLDAFAERFRGQVQLECLDWEAAIDKYDAEDTVFYGDPPYPDADRDYYHAGGDLDHSDLAARLADVEGDWLFSYSGVPDAFDRAEWTVVALDTHYDIPANARFGSKKATERLVLNFDPTERESFAARQSQLPAFIGGEP